MGNTRNSVPSHRGNLRSPSHPVREISIMTAEPAIELDRVTKRFATQGAEPYTALRDLDLTVEAGEFCAVVGPTGCGKSTTLTLVAGLERPSEGAVRVNGTPVDGITRGVGFMFQSDAILPWKTVLE